MTETSVLLLLTMLGSGRVWNPDWMDGYRLTAAKGPYFLCDERVVEDRWRIERFVAPLDRHPANPLIVRDRPWEGTGPHMGGSVLYDERDGVFRMWYTVWDSHAYYNALPFSYNVCYAESDDGIAWRKPSLGVFEYEGSTDNNCIRLGTDKTQNIDVMWNPKPEVFPGRLLAIHNQKGGVFVSSSDDGKTFTPLWPEHPAISHHSDTHNNLVYDEVGDYWLLFCRPRAWAGDHRRRVSVQLSRDLKHWTHERTILVPSEAGAPEFYGMTVFRRGDLFFGALQLYDRESQTLRPTLAWSGDGLRWDLLPGQDLLLPLGKPSAWDAGMVLLAETPVVLGDTMYFYYGGFALGHDTPSENVGAIGLATAGRDRLIGVRPISNEPGTIITRPFAPDGRRLVVNALVQGEIRAEVRIGNNKPVDGWTFDDSDPLAASGYESELTWGGKSLGAIKETEIRVIFRLTDAELFTFDLMR